MFVSLSKLDVFSGNIFCDKHKGILSIAFSVIKRKKVVLNCWSLIIRSTRRKKVLTPFFDTCQTRWFLWREGGQFGRNQKMHSIGIGRWSSSDGPEEYALKMLIRYLWYPADGELPMKSMKEKRIQTLRKSWWFGCNILGSLSFK